MGKRRKAATRAVVSNTDVAASGQVPVDVGLPDDDYVSVCSDLSAPTVVYAKNNESTESNAKLRADATHAEIISLEEEAAREMRLVEELASLKIKEIEVRRHEVEQKLEIQKRLSTAKRDAFGGQGSVISSEHEHDTLDHALKSAPKESHTLTDLVNSLRQIPNLPSVEMMKFDGDSARFVEFRTSFKLQVEKYVRNDVERFMRLLHLCEGKAKDAIQGCINLPPGQMYQTAWKDLTENFGKPYMVAEGQMRKLRECQVRRDDAESLLAFSRRLEEVHRAMSSMGESYLARLNDDDLLRKLMRKLPSESLQRRWVEKVGNLLEFQLAVTMKDFIDFVKGHGTRSNNVFGNELRSGALKGKSPYGSSLSLIHI